MKKDITPLLEHLEAGLTAKSITLTHRITVRDQCVVPEEVSTEYEEQKYLNVTKLPDTEPRSTQEWEANFGRLLNVTEEDPDRDPPEKNAKFNTKSITDFEL